MNLLGETVEVWELAPTSQVSFLEQGEHALKEFDENKMYYQNLLSFKKKIYLKDSVINNQRHN